MFHARLETDIGYRFGMPVKTIKTKIDIKIKKNQHRLIKTKIADRKNKYQYPKSK